MSPYRDHLSGCLRHQLLMHHRTIIIRVRSSLEVTSVLTRQVKGCRSVKPAVAIGVNSTGTTPELHGISCFYISKCAGVVRRSITKVPKYPYFGSARLLRFVTLKQMCLWLMSRLTKHFLITAHQMHCHPKVHRNFRTHLRGLVSYKDIHFWRHC